MSDRDIGRSWIVLVGSTLLMFIETGIVKSLGVLLPDIREQFSTKTWVIGFAISLTPGFGAVISVLSGAINKGLGPRPTIILFSFLCSIGLLTTTFADNIYTLSMTLLLTGFATGTTPVAGGVLSQYFDKYYNVAATVFVSGLSLGMVVMPLLTQFLLDIYGWRGTVLVLTGISLNSVVCGAVFKPSDVHEYIQLTSSVLAKPSNQRKNNYHHLAAFFEEYLDISLFSRHSFIGMASIFAGNGFYTTGWLIYVVPHVIELGFTPYEASVVAAIGGSANFIGNFLHPLAEKLVSNTAQLYVGSFMIAASLAFDVLAGTYASYLGLVMCAMFFGFGRGLMLTAFYPLMNDVIDVDKMVNAMGWFYGIYGFTSVLSGFICGWLYDLSGSYTLSFLVLSTVCLVTMIPQVLQDTRQRGKMTLEK